MQKKKTSNTLNLIWFTILTTGITSCNNGGQESSIPWWIVILILAAGMLGRVAYKVYQKNNPEKPKTTHSQEKTDTGAKRSIGDFAEALIFVAIALVIIYRVSVQKKSHPKQPIAARTTAQAYTTVLNTEAYPVIIQPGEKLDWNTNTDCALVYVGTNESNGHWQQVTQTQPVDLGVATYFMFKSCDNVAGTLSYTISPTN